MTREAIIESFTKNVADYKRAARNIAGDDHEDLFQEACLMILEMSDERLNAAFNQTEGLKPFFIRVLLNQYRSKTSKYHREYRKQIDFVRSKGKLITEQQRAEDLAEPEIDVEKVRIIRANVHHLNGELFPCEAEERIFEMYVEAGSLRKAVAAMPEDLQERVDLKTVHKIVKKYRRTIKSNYN